MSGAGVCLVTSRSAGATRVPSSSIALSMGLTYVDGRGRAPRRQARARRVRFLVDSGAVYSVLRQADWRALGLKPERELDFVLADGTNLKRGVSECVFEL